MGATSLTETIKLHDDFSNYPTNPKKIEFLASTILKDKLSTPMQLLEGSDKQIDTPSIKTAIEWAFDSSIEDSETIAFIKTCIGLEAILGEDIGEDSITKTLADRCAFLLGRNNSQRKKFREEFKKLYTNRSKIVHGRKQRLDQQGGYYLHWGKIVLDKIIKKEMGL